MSSTTEQKLELRPLIALVIGSMIGAGIFSLPQTFGRATGVFGALIAWAIAGTGMLMLAFVFQSLAQRKPDLDSGVFAYAKAGFGDYMGFLSALGYWTGCCVGNVTYWILIFSTLGLFFPIFGQGNTAIAIIISSVAIWLFHFMILRGVKGAATLNTIATVAKVIPILIFIILVAVGFKAHIFSANFWGGEAVTFANVLGQVRGTMLVTVFVFLGIEGAAVYQRLAAKRSDVGVATVLGFLSVLCVLVLVTVLSYGVLYRGELAGLQNPSMAGVLAAVVGPWGKVFVSLGLIISVLGAYLSWTLLATEVLFSAAKNQTMPSWIAQVNQNDVPVTALWLTSGLIQVFLLLTVFAQYAFTLALEFTSSMNLIPFFLVAGYAVLLAQRGQTYEGQERDRRGDLFRGTLAAVYTLFLLWAGGLKFLLLSCVIYAPGTLLYYQARREQKAVLFTPVEWLIFAAACIAAILAIYGLATNTLHVEYVPHYHD
jgi:arginine:ornithine antiporter / lysine permease